MLLPWHWFAIGTVVTSSVASLYLRAMMKKEENDPILFTIVFQFMLGIIVLLFAFYRGFQFPPSADLWPRLLLSGVLYSAGSLCNFYASKYIGAGEMTILVAVGAIISIILGVIFLGNSFSWGKALGTALILSSIFVLYGKEKMKMNIGVWYALGVAVFYGTAIVNDVIIIRTYNAISFVPVMCFLPGIIIALLFPKRLLKAKKLLEPKPLKHITLYSFFYGVAAITYYQALATGASVAQLSPISRASIIITVFLAALFLGERNNLGKKIISAVLVSVGVLLLA